MVWQKLGSATWSSGTTLDSGTFTANKYIRVECVNIIGSGSSEIKMRFNGDDGANYAYSRSQSGGANSSAVEQTSSGNLTPTGTDKVFCFVDIVNVAAKTKQCISYGGQYADSSTQPARMETVFKWDNVSDAITSVQIIGTFGTGSRISVYGNEGSVTTFNLPNGAIFEESDTDKHYMWDGTSAWNEIL